MIELKRINVYTSGKFKTADDLEKFKTELTEFLAARLDEAGKPAVYLSHVNTGLKCLVNEAPTEFKTVKAELINTKS